MISWLSLIATETRRSWTLQLRYPVETLSSLGVLCLAFFLILAGAQFISGQSAPMEGRLDELIVGFWLWSISIFALNSTAHTLFSESISGTLEQVFLSPFGARQIFVARMFSAFGTNLLSSMLLLFAVMVLTERYLTFSPTIIGPIITAVVCCYGLGMILGCWALLFKKVASLLDIFQFVLLILTILGVENWKGSMYYVGFLIPVSSSAGMLRDLMGRGEAIDWTTMGLCSLNGFIYFGMGLLVFSAVERKTRRLGILGHH